MCLSSAYTSNSSVLRVLWAASICCESHVPSPMRKKPMRQEPVCRPNTYNGCKDLVCYKFIQLGHLPKMKKTLVLRFCLVFVWDITKSRTGMILTFSWNSPILWICCFMCSVWTHLVRCWERKGPFMRLRATTCRWRQKRGWNYHRLTPNRSQALKYLPITQKESRGISYLWK